MSFYLVLYKVSKYTVLISLSSVGALLLYSGDVRIVSECADVDVWLSGCFTPM